jgi:hypothetical protein
LLFTVISWYRTIYRIRSNKIVASASLVSSVLYSEVALEDFESLSIFEVIIERKKYKFIFDAGSYTVLSKKLIETLRRTESKNN